MGKFKSHQKYYTKDGVLVKGVTTILNILNKQHLLKWANDLGLEGIKMSTYVDNLADIGTLAHAIISGSRTNTVVDYSDYSKNQIDIATVASDKFFKWQKANNLKHIKSEIKLVSDKYMFGGTADIYCDLDGKKTLIDLKTSKAVYGEAFIQTAAYKVLLEENGYPVDKVLILRIGRDPEEGFEEREVVRLDLYFKKFLKCLEIVQIDNQIKGG